MGVLNPSQFVYMKFWKFHFFPVKVSNIYKQVDIKGLHLILNPVIKDINKENVVLNENSWIRGMINLHDNCWW